MSEVNSVINKSMEQNVIDGALRGGLYVGMEFVRKELKVGKNASNTWKSFINVGELVLVELIYKYADKKGLLKWSKV